MSCFKDVMLICYCRKKRIPPKISPSPAALLPPPPLLKGLPAAEPPRLSQKTEERPTAGGRGARRLRRAASVGSNGCKGAAATFAASKTMSNRHIRRCDSSNDSPQLLERRTGLQPIIFSTSSGAMKPRHMELELECTLDELCFGCIKQIKVSRDVVTYTGLISKEDELMTVNVRPAWRQGTMITFLGGLDKETGVNSADVVFLIVEMDDNRFKRQEDNEEDLEMGVGLDLVDALTGCSLKIPLLGGKEMMLDLDDVIEHGVERVIEGQGMPKVNDPSQRGDLKIKFQVEFPKRLTHSQRLGICEILNG